MASINLSGILTRPDGEPDVGAVVRFTHYTTTGNTVKYSYSELVIPPDGAYDIDLEYGQVRIDYDSDYKTERFIAFVVVNQDSTATSIPELLNASVPPTDEQLLEFQALLADTVAAKDIAVAVSEQITTTELINGLNSFTIGDVIETSGFTSKGDDGTAPWQLTSVTGTPSQTPAQLGDALLNDADGRQWSQVFNTELNIKSIGGNDIGDNADVILAAENSKAVRVNLNGLTIETSISAESPQSVSKKYYNGTLLLTNVNGVLIPFKPNVVINDYELIRPRTKTPVLDWEGKNVLWLGTSIPIENTGGGGTYPDLFGKALGCNVVNKAWAGSHAVWDSEADPFNISTVKALSMTEQDRLNGLAAHGASSAYDDSFDVVTKASEMTCDYRIAGAFSELNFDVVMLDHNHNDRKRPRGVIDIDEITINSVTTGATTDVNLADVTGIAVGDSLGLRVSGIASLNYAAATITSISGNVVTLAFDSSDMVGSFTSGTASKLDKATVYGSFHFVIYFIKNLAIRYGDGDIDIVLSGAPSEHTDDQDFADDIWAIGETLKEIAEYWGFSFFDIGYYLDIKKHDHLLFMPDTVHPTTLASRQAIANHWIEWASGGASKQPNSDDFLPATQVEAVQNREPTYSKYDQGYAPRDILIGENELFSSNDFSSGFGTWTTGGTGTTPTIVTAPWDAGEFAIFNTTAAAESPYTSSPVANFGANPSVQFDLYLPEVSLVGTGETKQLTACQLRTSGQAYNMQVVAKEGRCNLRLSYFKEPNIDLVNNSQIELTIMPNTKYTVMLDVVKYANGDDGAALVYVNGSLLGAYVLENQLQTDAMSVRVGLLNNTIDNVDVYIGNVSLFEKEALDYSQRFTGDVVTSGGTLNIVNGVIVSVS